jgi:oligoendopeptidase F
VEAAVSETQPLWDLSHLFANEEDFQKEFAQLEALAELGGRWEKEDLQAAEKLLGACSAYFDTFRRFGRLAVYASASSDEDTRDSQRWARKVATQELGARLSAAWAWLPPRLVALRPQVEKALAQEPALAPYAFFLRDTLRQASHLLPPGEERVLAELSTLARAPYNLYQILTHADLPFPQFTLPDGQQVRLDQNGYVRLREHRQRQVRQQACQSFFATYRAFARTLACALDAHVRQEALQARLRAFPSALEAALFPNAIPVGVYSRLLEEAQKLLPLLDRLFALRQRALGLPSLAFYDLYVPWGEGSLASLSLEKAQELLLASLAPLGEEYLDILQTGLRSRWMDPYPRPGKRSGAYCAGGAYDVHPYVLMNFQGTLDSVSTLAHEWGHAVHTVLANRAQPYPTAEYPIFLAEIASTLNEALLFHELLASAATPQEKIPILSHLLEHLRGTFFRQAHFADFELAIFREVEQGGTLTEESLSRLYQAKQRHWLGHGRGVVVVDEDFAVEWAYIPHFYYGFYVYQYATSVTASTFFARQILAGEKGAKDRYLALLRAGGSAYPYELLCKAGVDLASPEPYQELGCYLQDLLQEAESCLAQGGENPQAQAAVS